MWKTVVKVTLISVFELWPLFGCYKITVITVKHVLG